MKNKLHLGSGNKILIGWQNLDKQLKNSYDARTQTSHKFWEAPYIKVEDNSVDFVFNEHFIEHLDEVRGFIFLQEIYRVLKPGGVLRICAPSLDKYVESFLKEDIRGLSFDENPKFRNGTQFLNYAIYGEGLRPNTRIEYLKNLKLKNFETFKSPPHDHRYLYSEKDLKEKLNFIGFKEAYAAEWGVSQYEDLIGVEHHKGLLELYVEAVK